MGSAFTPTFSVSAASVGEPQLAAGATLKLGTVVATTSGTAIDFTGIPAGTKQIIVSLSGVSTNGTSVLLVEIGDSGGIETSSYLGTASFIGTAVSPVTTTYTGSGFMVTATGGIAATSVTSGQFILTLINEATNLWGGTASNANDSSTVVATHHSAGVKALSAVLDRIRLTTVSGDTFDAGSINIAYK